jgi:hypothetical protein
MRHDQLYVILAIASTLIWPRVAARHQRWLLQALISIVAGVAWLLIDVVAGYLRNPSLPLLEAVTSTRLFFITLVLCPGHTVIALSGSVRGLLVHFEGKHLRVPLCAWDDRFPITCASPGPRLPGDVLHSAVTVGIPSDDCFARARDPFLYLRLGRSMFSRREV